MDKKILADLGKDYPALKKVNRPDYEKSEKPLRTTQRVVHALMRKNNISLKTRRLKIRVKRR